MSRVLVRLAIVAGSLFMIGGVIVPTAVHVGEVLTPTGAEEFPWTLPALLTVQMRGQAWPVATFGVAIALVAILVVVIAVLSHAAGLIHGDGRASIVRLRLFVWWKSRPRRAPLTAKSAEPLGRIGWFGFFGMRWFTDMLEETRVLVAASGAGKTVRLVVRLIRRAQGAVVTTSTKPDVLQLTAQIRKRKFPDAQVMVFDPEELVPWMGEDRVKWDIVAGCEDPKMAMKRAAAIVAARPLDGRQSTNSGFFTIAVTLILQSMLHAAAVDGRSMRDVMRWLGNYDDNAPYQILRDNPRALHAWEQTLQKYCRGKAEETVSSAEMTASGILDAFTLPEVLEAVCPTPGERVVDITRHHRTRDTLYLLCKGETSPAASVFTALVESLYKCASDDATRAGACVPPLELILDEAANVCAIPSLPAVMSTGRGEGIVPTIILQDHAQLVRRYSEAEAITIINNATQLMVMGGLKDDDYLKKLSSLAGSTDQLGRGWSKQVLAPEKIRTLRTGRAVMFYRNQPPTIITLPAWWRTRHKGEYQASLDWARNAQQSHIEHADPRMGVAA